MKTRIGRGQRTAAAAVLALAVMVPAYADKPAEQGPASAEAMAHMLRADRDKDGTVSRAELEAYDLTLSRRFREADADRDGKLTLKEFETLVPQAQSARNP